MKKTEQLIEYVHSPQFIEDVRRRLWGLIKAQDAHLLHSEEFAQVSHGTLSRFLNGKRGEEPSLRWLVLMALVHKADLTWFFLGEKPDPTKAYTTMKLEPFPGVPMGRPKLNSDARPRKRKR